MVPMVLDSSIRDPYWDYSFTPIRGESCAVAGVFNQGHETTERILYERNREAEAARQRRLFQQAPGFITILRGPDHIFEFVNDAYRRMFGDRDFLRSEEHTSELQSLMRNSYAVFCLKKKNNTTLTQNCKRIILQDKT